MKQRLSKQEIVLIAGAVVVGCFLRWSHNDGLAIEHFDEGIYSSPIWYERMSDTPYPARHLYAPPLLPAAITAAHVLTGSELAPFLPGLLAGSLSILVIWGFTRSCFGMAAGIVAVLLTAFSEFHIVFSRMALTDVPVLLWISLSVWLGVVGIERRSLWFMFMGGLSCGLAWWTKYSGWLPLAIVSAGSAMWWLTGGQRHCSLRRLLQMNATMVVTAALVWSPWPAMLQDFGGYAAVSANHATYVTGLSEWRNNLAAQVTCYTELDSWLTAAAISLAVLFAGVHRWYEACRSTWNSKAPTGTGVTAVILLRFVAAAILLPVVTLAVGSFGVLVAVGAGGLAGVSLWPVLTALPNSPFRPNGATNSGPPERCETDKAAAPGVDPRLGTCILAAWFGGMLLMTPMYTPFPRLLLPLTATLWMGAAAGVGWWIEASINVARRTAAGDRVPERKGLQTMVMVLAVFAVLIIVLGTGLPVRRSSIHDSHTALKKASVEVAAACEEDAAGQPIEEVPQEAPNCIVYTFGEPSVLFHLNALGLIALPVQDVWFPPAAFEGRDLPTYLVFGPNALRTPGFMYDWVDAESRFEHVGNVTWQPSSVVLFNLFRPQWIIQHEDEVRQQELEIWRIKRS